MKNPSSEFFFEIEIFKDNFNMRTLSPNGGSIAFQCPLSLAYRFWKGLLRITLDDQFYNQENAELYRLKNMISAVSFLLQPTSDKQPLLLAKLWISPQHDLNDEETPITGNQVGQIVNIYLENMDPDFINVFLRAKYLVNSSTRIYSVFRRHN